MTYLRTACLVVSLSVLGAMASAADIEPNSSFDTAYDLGTGAIDFDGSVASTDLNDFFKWTSVSGGLFTIDLLFSDAVSDLDLRLLDINDFLLDNSSGVTDNEQVSVVAEVGQMFVIRV